jgi:hypothetical protein
MNAIDQAEYMNSAGALESMAHYIGYVVTGKTAIVADMSNIFLGGLKHSSCRLDYQLLRTYFSGDELISADAVGSLPPNVNAKRRIPQVQFFKKLGTMGWNVHLHRSIMVDAAFFGRATPSGFVFFEDERAVDGQVKMLVSQFGEHNGCDIVVLLSGDGGMIRAVNYARSCGKIVIVLSWKHCLHNALRQAADEVFFIDDLIHLFAHHTAKDIII